MTTTTNNNNNNNNMQDLEAWFETDAKKAAKVSTPISFEIAKEAGVAITKEGPVAYEAGHYLVSNGLSPAYPVAPAAFGALYDISAEQQGVATPKAIEKLAKLATDEGSITTSWGVLAYRSGMDYIVRHADGDYGVVAVEIFDVTYYIIVDKRPFFFKTLAGISYTIELDPKETSAAVINEEIIEHLPETNGNWQIICEGKDLMSCQQELANGVGKYFSRLASIHVINRQPKRPRDEYSDSDSDSDSETTKAYDSHKKICSARNSNTSSMHGGAYLEDGVGYCTLCDEKL